MLRLSSVMPLAAAISVPTGALGLGEGTAAQVPGGHFASMTGDPNQMVCEKVEKIGSRLGSNRVCMTRAEGAEQRRQNRDTVDHAANPLPEFGPQDGR